jgi:hypothetical protein
LDILSLMAKDEAKEEECMKKEKEN